MSDHFGLPYHFPEVSLDRLKEKANMTEEEAAEMLTKFRRNFPALNHWMDELKKKHEKKKD